MTGRLALEEHVFEASNNKCMVGKFFQEFFMFLIN